MRKDKDACYLRLVDVSQGPSIYNQVAKSRRTKCPIIQAFGFHKNLIIKDIVYR